jgi:hypothetical protein
MLASARIITNITAFFSNIYWETVRIKNNCLLQCMCIISKQILLYGSDVQLYVILLVATCILYRDHVGLCVIATFSSIHKLKWPVLLSYLREWNQTGTELMHIWRTKKLFKIILNLYTCIQHTSTQPNIKRQNYIKVPGTNLVRQMCINSVPVWFHSRK